MLVKIETRVYKCNGSKFNGFKYHATATVEGINFDYILTAESKKLNKSTVCRAYTDVCIDSYHYDQQKQTFYKGYGDLDLDRINYLADQLEDLPVWYTDDQEGGKFTYSATIDTEPRQSEGIISIFITNLSDYNAGTLTGEWLGLPATEVQIKEALDRIGICEEAEGYFLTDWESEIDGLRDEIGEYSNIDDLNEMAEELSNLDHDQLDALSAILEGGHGNYDECLSIVLAGDYIVYYDCDTMEDVARQILEETGELNDLGRLSYYFDYRSFGRDLSFEGCYYESDLGMVEVIR